MMIKRFILVLLSLLLLAFNPPYSDDRVQRIPWRLNGSPTITSTSVASLTLAATIEPGELLLIASYGTGSPADVTPSGFTEIETLLASTIRISIYYKVAVGNEDGTSVSTINGTQDRSVGLRFPTDPARTTGDVGGIQTITWATSGINISTPNPAAETAAVGNVEMPLIALCLYIEGSGGVVTNPVSSITATGSTTSTGLEWRWFLLPPAGPHADFTCDEDDGGTNGLVAYWTSALGFK